MNTFKTSFFILALLTNQQTWGAKELQCKHINDLKIYFSAAVTGAYCQNAAVRCALLEKIQRLKPNHPLRQRFTPQLLQQLSYDLKECEVAVLLEDPEYLRNR